jgi:DNA-binding Lrp family transcriptional regulator
MKKAFVLINCDIEKEEDVLLTLRKINSITEAHGTFGVYDIIVEVKADTAELLREVITWKIRKLPFIKSTLTLIGLDGQDSLDQ